MSCQDLTLFDARHSLLDEFDKDCKTEPSLQSRSNFPPYFNLGSL